MKVAILGYGVEGQAAVQYWTKLGDDVTIHDQNTQITASVGVATVLGDDYLENLGQYDLIVRAPGLHPRFISEANPGIDLSEKLTSVTREFMSKCPARIIGVTGTKGKGTTTTLTGKILEAAGKTVYVGGNIGTPPLEFLDKLISTDWVVLEMSSFSVDGRDPEPPDWRSPDARTGAYELAC